MIANAQIEQMSREDLQALQLERLQKTLKWAMDKSFFLSGKVPGGGNPAGGHPES